MASQLIIKEGKHALSMPPTLRNIAIATAAVLGLAIFGYKQQLHLPKPSLNPFDDQWEMRTSWLRNNCDSMEKGMCDDFYYSLSVGDYKLNYQTWRENKDLIVSKVLLVPADTIHMTRSKLYHSNWISKASYYDSLYISSIDYTLLDSICDNFGYSPLGIYRLSHRDFGPRYLHQENGDTIDFLLVGRYSGYDSVAVRDFRSHHGRHPDTYSLEDRARLNFLFEGF